MRSLFAKILIWLLASVALALAGFLITTALNFSAPRSRQFSLGMLARFQMREAQRAYQQGGTEALAATLERFREGQQSTGVLADRKGRDLLTGQDYSSLIAAAEERPGYPILSDEALVIARPSQDGSFWYFLMVPRRNWFKWFLQPQYLWIVGLMVLLCYMLARYLTAPVRKLQKAVERFGHGDLSARAGSNRRDELGELARTFDRMAERTETLLAAERRLLLDISHELRSPLARLNVAVELARSGDNAEAALNRIQKEADRLNELLAELLQVTRAEGDPAALRLEPVRLDKLLEELVEDNTIEAKPRGSQVLLLAAQPAAADADEELLRRAIENVLRNAIRFAPAGTAVEVSLGSDGSTATVRVRDYGPGVPTEALEHIFDAFYRVENDRNRASGGTGLGLAIARRAIELHKGSIRARNASPGLEVEIHLPLPGVRPAAETLALQKSQ